MLQIYVIENNLVSSNARSISSQNPANFVGSKTSDEEPLLLSINDPLQSGPQLGGLVLPPSDRLVVFCDSAP